MTVSSLWIFAVTAAQPLQTQPVQPSISVTGNGSDSTAPDLANLTFEIRGESAGSQAALKELGAKSAAVQAALRAIDPDLTLTDRGVTIKQIKGPGCTENEDEDRLRLSQGACAVVGYRVSQRFLVRTGRVLEAGTMAGVATRGGALEADVSEFSLADEQAAKARAIAAALHDARTKAEAVASAGHFSLGPIISVQVDGARGLEVVVTGSRRRPAPSPELDGAIVPVVLKPEPVRTSAEVTVSFAIRS